MAEATVKECKPGLKGEVGLQRKVRVGAICAVGPDEVGGAASCDKRN